jgi:hypothetical protein
VARTEILASFLRVNSLLQAVSELTEVLPAFDNSMTSPVHRVSTMEQIKEGQCNGQINSYHRRDGFRGRESGRPNPEAQLNVTPLRACPQQIVP